MLAAPGAYAQNAAVEADASVEAPSGRVLRVGVAGAAPFVTTDEESHEPSGFSVDVWRAVAEQNH